MDILMLALPLAALGLALIAATARAKKAREARRIPIRVRAR